MLTVGDLFSSFLSWSKENRCDARYRRRKQDCSRKQVIRRWAAQEGICLADHL
jgi:hypothetical protein